jgi:uridine kinase
MLKFFFSIFTFLILSHPLFSVTKVIIGIAGGSGSGKTTLANNIQKAFPNNSIIISQDSYYKDLSHLSEEERGKTNFDHPQSLDFALLEEHLTALKSGHSISQPVYNFHHHSREPFTKTIEPAEIIIVEGILLFAVPEVYKLFDMKFFVDTDGDIRLLRRIERDIKERSRTLESVRDQYLATVKPMYALYVDPSKQQADMIVPHGGHNQTALALIITRLKDILAKDDPKNRQP